MISVCLIKSTLKRVIKIKYLLVAVKSLIDNFVLKRSYFIIEVIKKDSIQQIDSNIIDICVVLI